MLSLPTPTLVIKTDTGWVGMLASQGNSEPCILYPISLVRLYQIWEQEVSIPVHALTWAHVKWQLSLVTFLSSGGAKYTQERRLEG